MAASIYRQIAVTAARAEHLEEAEELRLIAAWQTHADSSARDRLVTSHMGLIVNVAKKVCAQRPQMLNDLVQEGVIAFMHAIDKFDPEKNRRLNVYGKLWVRARLVEHTLANMSAVRVVNSRNQRKVYYTHCRKMPTEAEPERLMTASEMAQIADNLAMDERDVVHVINRVTGSDLSLDQEMTPEGGSLHETLPDGAPGPEEAMIDRDEQQWRRDELLAALDKLPPRERAIFEGRRMSDPPVSLEDLSREFGISKQRVQQIEKQAFERLRRLLDGKEKPGFRKGPEQK